MGDQSPAYCRSSLTVTCVTSNHSEFCCQSRVSNQIITVPSQEVFCQLSLDLCMCNLDYDTSSFLLSTVVARPSPLLSIAWSIVPTREQRVHTRMYVQVLRSSAVKTLDRLRGEGKLECSRPTRPRVA